MGERGQREGKRVRASVNERERTSERENERASRREQERLVCATSLLLHSIVAARATDVGLFIFKRGLRFYINK